MRELHFNTEGRAGANSLESFCAYDNKWRKDNDNCPNWSERSYSLSPKDRIEIAAVKRQESLLREASKKKWYEKPSGLILIGVIVIVLGYFATEFFSSLKQKSQQVQPQSRQHLYPMQPKRFKGNLHDPTFAATASRQEVACHARDKKSINYAIASFIKRWCDNF